jgi:RNA polymerase sigma-70 factor (ECF subfamily)
MQNPRFYNRFSEEELVDRSKNGDNRAFSELIRRHHSSCANVARAILHDLHDAEDETQNALLKAYRHIGQFQNDSKFSTWLTRIVVNQCLMRLRQSRRAKLVYLDEPLREDTRGTELRSTSANPEDEIVRSQLADVLRREIRRIPPLLRDVFVLRDVQELPMTDVAGRLGISTAAAKSRLLRARLELRNRMSRYQGRTGPAALIA